MTVLAVERLRRQFPERRLLFLFSNRLGCVSSLAISALGTLVLLWALGWIQL